jgi:hypothetical protein
LLEILEEAMPREDIVLANPFKTRIIAEAQIKTDKVDAPHSGRNAVAMWGPYEIDKARIQTTPKVAIKPAPQRWSNLLYWERRAGLGLNATFVHFFLMNAV